MSVTEEVFSKLGVKNEYLGCSVMGTESLTMVLNNSVRLIRVAIIFGGKEVLRSRKSTEFRLKWAGRCAARGNIEDADLEFEKKGNWKYPYYPLKPIP